MFKRAINIASVGALCAAVMLGVLWLNSVGSLSATWEAGATVLALLAALAGIPAERWAAARERRSSAWKAVLRERDENLDIITDDLQPLTLRTARRRVYPRLLSSALTMAVSSGTFSTRTDTELLQQLLDCQNDVAQLNQRLDLIELRMFLSPSVSAQDLVDLDRPLYRPDGYVAVVKASLSALTSESGRAGVLKRIRAAVTKARRSIFKARGNPP